MMSFVSFLRSVSRRCDFARLSFVVRCVPAGLLVVLSLLATDLRAAATGAARDDFMPLVRLAPFVVNGEQLAISVHARSNRDRRYAEAFAEEVVKVVYESVTESTGRGLVIIGAKGEPHPIVVFRKFLALADAGKLDPAVAARGPELFAMIDRWQNSANDAEAGKGGKDGAAAEDLEFDKIVTALPLPLEGIGAKLYQIAWAERFDDAKVEAKLRALRAEDLERDWFAHFDWVFYLPPKGAFDRVLDELIADALKEEDTGFFTRVAVKSALLVVKSEIRRAIESLRRSLMLMTVVEARTPYERKDVESLMGAYLDALMPDEKPEKGTEHERAVKAVRAQLQRNKEKAETPASGLAPAPIGTPSTQSSAET